jgi:Right handed beta helix region
MEGHVFKSPLPLIAMLIGFTVLIAFALWAQPRPTSGGPPGFIHTVDTVVDGDTDDEFCSLRESIIASNGGMNMYNGCVALASFDRLIHFDLPACPPTCTIDVTGSALPAIIAGDLTVDGTTQPGYPGEPIVTVDGSGLNSSEQGLFLQAANITIRGLVIEDFPGAGVNADFTEYDGRRVENSAVLNNGTYGIMFTGSDAAVLDSIIEGNGDAGIGARFAGAGTGLLVQENEITGNGGGGVGSSFIDTTITDNIISGNGERGVDASEGITVVTDNIVSDNALGIFAGGDMPQVSGNIVTGNGEIGVSIGGGPGVLTENIISGNGFDPEPGDPPGSGVELGGQAGKTVTDNVISDNAGPGIAVFSSDHTIGGGSPPDANVITGNGGSGVYLDLEPDEQGNTISGNSIFANAGLGIDIPPADVVNNNDPLDADIGANGLQNFPVLATATAGSVTVTGQLNGNPSTGFRIEFFHNDACDSSGFGEGQMFLGEITEATDQAGNAAFQTFIGAAPTTGFITATATSDATGDTSEFSNCIPITPPATPTPTPSPTSTPTPTATLTPTPTTTPTPTDLVWGDHNCSGGADPIDGLLTLRHDAGLGADTGDCPDMGEEVDVVGFSLHPWGDVDCNGTINPVDALKLLRYDAGLEVQQEAGCPEIGDEVPVVS